MTTLNKSASLADRATPAARLETARLDVAYRAHKVACIRAAVRPMSFDDWFYRVIIATLSKA